MKNQKYLLIGSGRAAKHLCFYLNSQAYDVLTWSRKTSSVRELQSALAEASFVILAISDSALSTFVQSHLSQFQGTIVHLSGALEIPGTIGVHPLMSFGPELYELQVYKSMSLAVSAGAELGSLFPGLENPWFHINAKDRALYHAWAVFAGNFATLLWQQAIPGLQKIGAPKSSIHQYLNAVLSNAVQDPSKALTGPLARKDFVTIERHLEALPAPARDIYQAFVSQHLVNPQPREIEQ